MIYVPRRDVIIFPKPFHRRILRQIQMFGIQPFGWCSDDTGTRHYSALLHAASFYKVLAPP